MFVGILVLVVGIIFLLQNLGYVSGNVWGVVWPLIVIMVGLSMVYKNKKGPIFKKKNK